MFVRSAVNYDNVVKITGRVEPKAIIERNARAFGVLVVSFRGVLIAIFAEPIRQQAKRVVPERVNLHCFAATRGDDPSAHLGVHPGELITFLALHEQAVAWIDMNVEARAAQMMFDDLDQDGQKKLQRGPIGSALKITAESVKEPKCCVRGIVSPFLGAVGKPVRNQTLPDLTVQRAR